MKPVLPIPTLKRRARLLARRENLPLHRALDRIAATQGFESWSLLARRHAAASPAQQWLERLAPGDLVLIAARPRQGKTLAALELAAAAARAGRRSAFYTLEETQAWVQDRLAALGTAFADIAPLFSIHDSDAVSAAFIMEKEAETPPGGLVVVDYLQALDQRRDTPDLESQVAALRAFARERKLTMVFLSQVHRSFAPEAKALPDLSDIRLPNPLDLALFDKACFLHGGEARFAAVA